MRKPRRLVSGDRIAIVAPASPFDRSRFDRGVAEIERIGLQPVLTEGVFDRRGYVAGEARRRAGALTAAWRDPSGAAVIGARGGYGSAQLLPLLDGADVGDPPRAFIGHSDLTALLAWLATRRGVVCFHGPMVVNLGDGAGAWDEDSFRRGLMAGAPMGELAADGVQGLRPGDVRGPLLGGTLTQLTASLGTPHAFSPPAGYVLLLDDVGERPFRIDRMLTQLLGSGVLGRAAAVVCGEFPECDEPDGRSTARGVVADLLAAFPGPVLFGFPTGHTTGPALTVPLGVEVRVAGGPRPRVAVTESAVC